MVDCAPRIRHFKLIKVVYSYMKLGKTITPTNSVDMLP